MANILRALRDVRAGIIISKFLLKLPILFVTSRLCRRGPAGPPIIKVEINNIAATGSTDFTHWALV